MKRFLPAQQAEGRNEAEQAKGMVSMKMGNKDPMDLPQPDPEPAQLHLGAFTAVDQKKPLIRI